ncbi:MAG: hypothetical protein EKK63_11155 [Acinetobacter sp.]|uniref:hypothetical protein n=1 Tax=Acinetobacter sp. TaxID=472 RepID=UPI000F932F30|nr:hypothetical protein [Acinetobacter sp.]RUP38918.1 MAG: hypothetical protein EKK63_11155 [Acinetobacter sp.]
MATKYPLLNDSAWLRDRYLGDGLSTITIARLAGAKTCNSARQALLRYNIPVRNQREAQIHQRVNDFILNESVVNGCLLGDGKMGIHSKTSELCVPYFAKKNKYQDHIEYVAGFLFEIPDKFVQPYTEKFQGQEFNYWTLRSYSQECLKAVYEKWYPVSNGYKKVVPLDMELDAVSLLHWFMDDGSSYRRQGYGRRSKQIIISFACESFTKEEQEFLAQQMWDKWGLYVNVRQYRIGHSGEKQYRMHLRQSQSDLFFEIIGDCPVESMQYKWK